MLINKLLQNFDFKSFLFWNKAEIILEIKLSIFKYLDYLIFQ
jgi:SPX domain protein involved in polyphosphate accumulation